MSGALTTTTLIKAGLTRARALRWRTLGQRTTASGLRVLLYHRVSDDDDSLAVRPARFSDQIAFLSGQGYEVVDALSGLRRLADGTLGPRTMAVTFDDGYRDVAENALPVLEEHHFSATVFIATDVIDGSATYYWYEQVPPLLDWDAIVALDRQGTLRFEAHSLTHPNLTTLTDADCRREITESGRALAARLERDVTAFCYPGSFHGERERRFVIEAGFSYGITCEPGLNTPSTDPFLIRRIQIERTDTLLDFRAKVAGSHDRPLPGKALYRHFRYGRTERSRPPRGWHRRSRPDQAAPASESSSVATGDRERPSASIDAS